MTARTLAARLTAFGAAPEVTECALPEPDSGDVLVEMHYASLNPVDTYVIAGAVGAEASLPRTVGVEGAGLCGGRPVVVHGGGLGIVRDGTWSARVIAPADAVVPVPDGLSLTAAATAAVAGATAIRVTRDVGEVGPLDRVLVLGASGGVGQAVVSRCVDEGAQVWAQTADAAKAPGIAALGATPIVAGTAAQLLEEADSVVPTLVFDALGRSFTGAAVELLADHGRLVSYGVSAGPDVTVSMRSVYRKNLRLLGYGGLTASPRERRAGIEAALAALNSRAMTVPIHQIHPLDEVAAALKALSDRAATGKILLDLRAGARS
ncbi:zinc-binding alcohol dehydrogenase family protein [Streptomyces sp. NPDC051976]|uniref:quinone oxidoreductase family protein n=1 Tax=Streptomyces sp. NPDC051976 TaxID=3154947 RepID=UPI003435ABA2